MHGSLRESGFLFPSLAFFFPPLLGDLAGHPSLSFFPISHLPEHPGIFHFSIQHGREAGWWGAFQHFINSCLCCLICYPFRFMVFLLSTVCGQTKTQSLEASTIGISPCSFFNSYSMCGTKPWEAPCPFNTSRVKYSRMWALGWK